MAIRYALVEFTDAKNDQHEPGGKIDVDVSTDEEKVTDQRLLDSGVYSRTRPEGTAGRAAARGEQETS